MVNIETALKFYYAHLLTNYFWNLFFSFGIGFFGPRNLITGFHWRGNQMEMMLGTFHISRREVYSVFFQFNFLFFCFFEIHFFAAKTADVGDREREREATGERHKIFNLDFFFIFYWTHQFYLYICSQDLKEKERKKIRKNGRKKKERNQKERKETKNINLKNIFFC